MVSWRTGTFLLAASTLFLQAALCSALTSSSVFGLAVDLPVSAGFPLELPPAAGSVPVLTDPPPPPRRSSSVKLLPFWAAFRLAFSLAAASARLCAGDGGGTRRSATVTRAAA